MSHNYIEFKPTAVISPGSVLARELEHRQLKKQDFAKRCGRTPKLISEILSGEAPVIAETAIQFERVLGIDAATWLNLESKYQVAKKKSEDHANWALKGTWLKKFPLLELVKRDFIANEQDTASKVSQLLKFFGAASPNAFDEVMKSTLAEVNYRRDASHTDHIYHEMCWLRMGRLLADKISCRPYNSHEFKEILPELRALTDLPMHKFLPTLRERCASVGVAVVVVEELQKTHTSGASRWLSKDKAIIQLSNRRKSNDIFWFNFFHECCHILKHSKKKIFWDDDIELENEVASIVQDEIVENEADQFAGEMLVPRNLFNAYFDRYPYAKGRFTKSNIVAYADEIGIAPGVLVGQFQKHNLLTWKTTLNKLKIKLEVPSK